MFCRRKLTLAMLRQSVRNFARNEIKTLQKLNVQNKMSEEFLQVMYVNKLGLH